MLVSLFLSAVALSPVFIIDLQLCQSLEALVIDAIWEYDVSPGDAWPALDNVLTPLQRLYTASLYSIDGRNGRSESSAAAYGTAALARLARNTCDSITAMACTLNSVADIQLLFPQLPPGSAQISLVPRPDWEIPGQTLVDIRLEYRQATSPATIMSREFTTRQYSIPALFDAVKLWLGASASRLMSVSLHRGLADQVAVALQLAMEFFEGSEFRACDISPACSHFCRTGNPLPKAW